MSSEKLLMWLVIITSVSLALAFVLGLQSLDKYKTYEVKAESIFQ